MNFHKSGLININVSRHFLLVPSNFISCKIRESSFIFLGIPIGCNLRRIKTWSLMVDKFKSMLALWRWRFMYFAGRITLINLILSSLPIFFFLYYKAPVRIWKDIDKIRQQFLWGGSEAKSKIHWLKWDLVCRAKDMGWLSVKSIQEFSLALLSKWKWRILEDKNSLCKRVPKARYGGIEHQVLTENLYSRKSTSSWWQDLIKMEL